MSDDAAKQAQAQMNSVLDMVAALEVDYDRLEELKEDHNPDAWDANWSLVGCLPENDAV